MEERPVLRHARRKQLSLDQNNEVDVQCTINDQKDDFLNPIPDIVYLDPMRGDLESGGNPDDIDGDVDAQDNGKGAPFEPELLAFAVDEKRYAVAYDLDQTLHFQSPASHEDHKVHEPIQTS